MVYYYIYYRTSCLFYFLHILKHIFFIFQKRWRTSHLPVRQVFYCHQHLETDLSAHGAHRAHRAHRTHANLTGNDAETIFFHKYLNSKVPQWVFTNFPNISAAQPATMPICTVRPGWAGDRQRQTKQRGDNLLD